MISFLSLYCISLYSPCLVLTHDEYIIINMIIQSFSSVEIVPSGCILLGSFRSMMLSHVDITHIINHLPHKSPFQSTLESTCIHTSRSITIWTKWSNYTRVHQHQYRTSFWTQQIDAITPTGCFTRSKARIMIIIFLFFCVFLYFEKWWDDAYPPPVQGSCLLISSFRSRYFCVCVCFQYTCNGEFIVHKKEKTVTFIMTHKHSYT